MANSFFSRFPKIKYNLGKAEYITLTNIIKNVDADDFFANNSAYYTYHNIQDGDRPDTVSYKLYENPNYHWTFFILNNDLRSGLNTNWPLSYFQLDKMLVREYDPYSVVTIKPHNEETNTGLGGSGLANLLNLLSEYLQYLRLVNGAGLEEAKILRYDNDLLQFIIYDIVKTSTGLPVSEIKSFINSTTFKLKWVNPFEVDTDEYIACNELKLAFVNETISEYAKFDALTEINVSIFEGLETQEEIDDAVNARNAQYVFNKVYKGTSFNWVSYRNAASEFYTEDSEGEQQSISGYDVVYSENTGAKYISNEEKETLLNERKEKIRVVRKERMNDFIKAYFATLNS
jgi:hypothetical protein